MADSLTNWLHTRPEPRSCTGFDPVLPHFEADAAAPCTGVGTGAGHRDEALLRERETQLLHLARMHQRQWLASHPPAGLAMVALDPPSSAGSATFEWRREPMILATVYGPRRTSSPACIVSGQCARLRLRTQLDAELGDLLVLEVPCRHIARCLRFRGEVLRSGAGDLVVELSAPPEIEQARARHEATPALA